MVRLERSNDTAEFAERFVQEDAVVVASVIDACSHENGSASVVVQSRLGIKIVNDTSSDARLALFGTHQLFHRGHDVRHQHARGTQAIGVLVAHVAADRIQESMDLALGVMEAAGARPAVGAAEDRPVGMLRLYAREFLGHEIERLVPRHLDERLLASTLGMAAGPVFQPAFAHRRPAHAQARDLGRWARDRDPSRRDAGEPPGRHRRIRLRRRPSGRW